MFCIFFKYLEFSGKRCSNSDYCTSDVKTKGTAVPVEVVQCVIKYFEAFLIGDDSGFKKITNEFTGDYELFHVIEK